MQSKNTKSKVSLRNRLRFLMLFTGFVFTGLFIKSCREKTEVLPVPEIISFKIKGIPVQDVHINADEGLITVQVPYGILLQDCFPEITFSEPVSIVPSLSVAQDFSKDVYYTVSSPSGGKKVYKVITKRESQPLIVLTGLSPVSLRAGDTVSVSGENFGKRPILISVYLQETGQEALTKADFRLIDSVTLHVAVPPGLKPAPYHLVVKKQEQQTRSVQQLDVRIPAPVITDIKHRQLQQGDTLFIAGQFIEAGGYTYSVLLEQGGVPRTLPPLRMTSGGLTTVIPENLAPAEYTVSVANQTEQVVSKPAPASIRIYDNSLPFVSGVTGLKTENKAEDVLLLRTVRFASVPSRFYTVLLSGFEKTFSVNGIYDHSGQTLKISLPPDILPSAYQMQVLFLDDQGAVIYTIILNDRLNIVR